MSEKVNKFCYSKMIDINLEEKANTALNSDCAGCIYFDFCLKDKVQEVKKVEKESTKKPVKTDVKEGSNNGSSETEENNDVVDNKVKTESKTKAKSTKPKTKKASLEDLVEEDIF